MILNVRKYVFERIQIGIKSISYKLIERQELGIYTCTRKASLCSKYKLSHREDSQTNHSA